jgi:flagellar biosynthesis/type III secretory pathway M-ring protein FliF/YscJ
LVGPNGEIGVRRRPFPWELIIVLGAGIVIIVLIILAVRYLVRIRKNNKAKDD